MQDTRQSLVFIDLDGTLVDGDSFRYFLSRFKRDPRVFAVIVFAGLLRKARILSRAAFFRSTLSACRKSPLFTSAVRETVVWCSEHLRHNVLDHARGCLAASNCPDGLLVIVSASPADYLEELEAALNIRCFGSSYDGPYKYRHLYGREKLALLEEMFPKGQFRRLAAYSDCKSDEPLMSTCEQGYLVDRTSGHVNQWRHSEQGRTRTG